LSRATDLVAGQSDANGDTDVFLFDRVSGTNTLVSHISASPATTGNQLSEEAVLSGDGRYVAFRTRATDLVAGVTDTNDAGAGDLAAGQSDANADPDFSLSAGVAGTTTLASPTTASPATTGNQLSEEAVLSGDGRYVAFRTRATDLVAGVTDTNGAGDVYLFD